jgi:hypothetical protein
VNAERLLPAENRRPLDVWPMLSGFRRGPWNPRTRQRAAWPLRIARSDTQAKPILKATCLVFVRLAQDQRFVGAVLFVVFLLFLGLFVVIRI